MGRKALDKLVLTEAKKTHYSNLHSWLKLHPQITFKKLNPVGFSIDVGTIPNDLVEEFISISTFKED